jgi:hypothetical protein
LLLRPEPFIFNNVTISITEQQRRPKEVKPREDVDASKPPTTALSFAPRAARRPGIGKGRQAPVDKKLEQALPATVKGTGTQDEFRAMMEAKNRQRGGQSAEGGEKRAAEDGEEPEAKRTKQE